MLGTTSRRGGGSKQRQAAAAAAEADEDQQRADDSPRFTSGSAKAEAVGRGSRSTVSSLPKVVLVVILVVVGTVFAVKVAREEVRISFHLSLSNNSSSSCACVCCERRVHHTRRGISPFIFRPLPHRTHRRE